MSSFNYSTGNPNNLVGGGAANMTDIGGSFTDLRSFINGGAMDETNVPNLAAAFTSNKPWLHLGGAWSGGSGNTTYLLTQSLGVTPPGGGTAGSVQGAVRWDPVDFNANARVTKLFFRCFVQASSTSPALPSVAVFMAPVILNSQASTVAATIGTTIAASQLTFNTVNASFLQEQTVEFSAPAAGYYAFCAQMNLLAASSYLQIVLDVKVHQT